MFDLIEHSAMINKKLKAAIKRLLSKDRKLIRMKDLRLLVKSNEELSDIKLTGKGRTKIAIVSDLESRIKQKKTKKVAKKKTEKQKAPQEDDTEDEESDASGFEVNPNGTYSMNDLTSTEWCIVSFIKEDGNKHYAKKLTEEFEKEEFSSWEDVEKRVTGFKRNMLKHFDTIYWSFDPNHLKGVSYCTSDHDLKRFKCSIVSEKELKELIQKQKDHSEFNGVDYWEDEQNGLCLSWKEVETTMNEDPRKPQKVSNRNGNIVMIASFDKKSGLFEGHGSGCLIDERHVLTCAHLFVQRGVKYQKNLIWSVQLCDGSFIGIVNEVMVPKLWPPKNDAYSTKSSNDVAVLQLSQPFKSKFPYPVFGLALKKYEHPKKGANITIDGYPTQFKREPANGWNRSTGKLLCNLLGHFGNVTKSGLDSKSLRSLAFFTPGTSGAAAMLCDEKGQYLTNGKSPIIVGIAVNLGLLRTGESTVCVPMKPWTLAFVSGAIGKRANVHNEYVRRQMVCYMNKYKAKMNKYSQDDDVEMKCDD